jgi:hypothetical protein
MSIVQQRMQTPHSGHFFPPMLNLPQPGKQPEHICSSSEVPNLRPGLESLGEYILPEVSDSQLEA